MLQGVNFLMKKWMKVCICIILMLPGIALLLTTDDPALKYGGDEVELSQENGLYYLWNGEEKIQISQEEYFHISRNNQRQFVSFLVICGPLFYIATLFLGLLSHVPNDILKRKIELVESSGRVLISTLCVGRIQSTMRYKGQLRISLYPGGVIISVFRKKIPILKEELCDFEKTELLDKRSILSEVSLRHSSLMVNSPIILVNAPKKVVVALNKFVHEDVDSVKQYLEDFDRAYQRRLKELDAEDKAW